MTLQCQLSSRLEASGQGAGVLSIQFPRGFYFKTGPRIWSQSAHVGGAAPGSQGTWTVTSHHTVDCGIPG